VAPVVGWSVDAHVHLWTRSTDPQPWIDPVSMAAIDRDFTATDLAVMLEAADSMRTADSMGTAIVVQSSNNAAETRRLLAGAADPAGRVAGVVGWLDLTGDVVRQLDASTPGSDGRLVGARHLVHIDPDPNWLERPDVGRGLAALGRAGLCFDLVVRWWQLPQVLRLAGDHPAVSLVLDHLGGPPVETEELAQWERSLRLLAAHPNVTTKLSGVADTLWHGGSVLDAYRPVIEVALEAFGPSRLMYGSDWPLVELAGGVPVWQDVVRTLTGELTAGELEQIHGSTAAGVYHLSAR
jgi:L-fuconolactonase